MLVLNGAEKRRLRWDSSQHEMPASKNLAKYSGPVQTHECPAERMLSTNRTLDAVLFAAEEGAPWSRTVLPWGDEVFWKRCPDLISGNGTEV